MRKVTAVMKQEFIMTAANRAFIIITIIGPFLILAVSILPGLLSTSADTIPEGTTIAITGAEGELAEFLQAALRESGLETRTGLTLEKARRLVLGEAIHGVLAVPEDPLSAERFTYFSGTGTDMVIVETIKRAVGKSVVAERLSMRGIAAEEVEGLTRQPALDARKVTPTGEGEGQDFFSVFATAMTFVMLLYMTVLLYGQMIGRSVLTEKTSKTVEIMLSSVRPLDLLFGKIFGKGLAGLLQYGIWIGIALLIAYLLGPLLGISLPGELTAGNLGFLVLFFILAFFLYSSAYAALGAGAQDEQHLGQLGWPLILFLVIPLVTISAYIMNPNSSFSVILSFFPMTSPIVMLIRIILDTPPAWEILLCCFLLCGTIFGFIVMAAKIFRVGILMTGKRAGLKEILRWVRY